MNEVRELDYLLSVGFIDFHPIIPFSLLSMRYGKQKKVSSEWQLSLEKYLKV